MEKIIQGKRQCELLCEYCANMEYGDTVTHTTIANIIGEKIGTVKYYTVIQKARKMLLNDKKVYLESVREVGYRKTIPDDFTKVSVNEYRIGFKRIQKGKNILTNAPISDMSEEGKADHRYVMDRTRQLEASWRGAIVEMKTIAKKPSAFQIALSKQM